MKDFYIKHKPIILGFILSLLTLLFTYLIFGLIQKNFYLWGVVQLIISIGFLFVGWVSAGMINRNIRRVANNKFEDTSYKNPKKAEYKVFITTCYITCLFGLIINLIGYYAFGLGKYIPETIIFIKNIL